MINGPFYSKSIMLFSTPSEFKGLKALVEVQINPQYLHLSRNLTEINNAASSLYFLLGTRPWELIVKLITSQN
jgi:hypothetical protein